MFLAICHDAGLAQPSQFKLCSKHSHWLRIKLPFLPVVHKISIECHPSPFTLCHSPALVLSALKSLSRTHQAHPISGPQHSPSLSLARSSLSFCSGLNFQLKCVNGDPWEHTWSWTTWLGTMDSLGRGCSKGLIGCGWAVLGDLGLCPQTGQW